MSKRYLVTHNLVRRAGNKQAVSQHEDTKTQRHNDLFAFAPSSLRGFVLQLWRYLCPDILAIVATMVLLAGCGGQPQTLVPTNASPALPKPTEQPATAAPALPTTPPSAVPSPTAKTADTPAPATSAPAAPTALSASAVSDP